MTIPKKIHYCWLGGKPLTPLANKCIESWKKYCPDYEILEWNERNFDISCNKYVQEAYESKKFAFVTDYVRLYVLYYYGGIYMDTDVEAIKCLDIFLNDRAFTGCESEKYCCTGIIAAEKNHPWIARLLDGYNERHFILENGEIDYTPNTQIITKLTIEEYGWQLNNEHQLLKDGLNIYPFEYFCAKDLETGKLVVTNNTYTIHHFSGSWLPKTTKLKQRVKQEIKKVLGPNMTKFIIELKHKLC